ncbi:CmpA/NrtA family ABC transporter substrate-binding protein [Opitutus terrae]|uniref:Nitrate transporter, putative n=1 Tax=Opitutus terrae (strain DSM 11246 / JCM 15787 / PB90-1) TaxID=452637 RepID=B1ZVT2_OPITP|nr:CmpA/NrtA family ABC transporter substrate-binding protein [Opitutus terrae]ACB75018.1 nitrate transporter, putative [Opitutus terrae PB90-1]
MTDRPLHRTSRAAVRPLRIGFLALTDAAPLIVAEVRGLFRQRGLDVVLQREVGWATIREKILYGELDAAQAPAPMLWSTRLGIECAPSAVLTAFVFNLHGSALTLSSALHAAGAQDPATLRSLARSRRGESRLTFGIVFPFSSHHLLLRRWLAAAGLRPEHDVRIVVVPPAQMFRNLEAGTIDGYCAGEPWNSVAVRAGRGWCPTWSAAQFPGLAEKVLMVTEAFARHRGREHAALVSALTEAAAWCDAPANRAELARLLSGAAYLNLPERVITPALSGAFDCGFGRIEALPDFLVFHRDGANAPDPAKALALQHELVSAGLVPPKTDPRLPRQLFREDLFREAFPCTTYELIAPSCSHGL